MPDAREEIVVIPGDLSKKPSIVSFLARFHGISARSVYTTTSMDSSGTRTRVAGGTRESFGRRLNIRGPAQATTCGVAWRRKWSELIP